MLPWSAPLAGRFEELVVDSAALRGNPLGDPHERPLMVYLPPGYDHDDSRRYPSVRVAPQQVYFELFDAGHGGIEYRYPLALAWLCQRIAE
jgi:hypothetical protein